MIDLIVNGRAALRYSLLGHDASGRWINVCLRAQCLPFGVRGFEGAIQGLGLVKTDVLKQGPRSYRAE